MKTWWKICVGLLLVLLLASAGWASYEIIALQVLSTKLIIPAMAVLILIVLIMVVLLLLFTRHWVAKLLISLLVVVMSLGFSFSGYYLVKTNGFISKVSVEKPGMVKNTVSLIVMKDSHFNQLKDLKGEKVGQLETIDVSGTKRALKDAKKQKIQFEKVDEVSIEGMVDDLYANKVSAIILNESYRPNVTEIEKYAKFKSETKVIHQTVYYTANKNKPISVSDVTSKPFTILISGDDTYGDISELSRSDVDLLVTINPKTGRVLMTSLPRDLLVPVSCDTDDWACPNGKLDKLTHTGLMGVATTKKTIEELLGITINYTFRVNFSSAESIVDALGGIDVEIPEGMAVETFYADSTLQGVTEGWNHLDGKRALAFARERYAYEDGDLQRNRNQQTVSRAIVQKAISAEILSRYTTLLEALGNAFETNMSEHEIKSLIQYQLDTGIKWRFSSALISGTGDTRNVASLGMPVYTMIPNQLLLDNVREKIQATEKGENPDDISVPEGFEMPNYVY